MHNKIIIINIINTCNIEIVQHTKDRGTLSDGENVFQRVLILTTTLFYPSNYGSIVSREKLK
jgi:hypothetical protein